MQAVVKSYSPQTLQNEKVILGMKTLGEGRMDANSPIHFNFFLKTRTARSIHLNGLLWIIGVGKDCCIVSSP
jgi:hypothetical protein